MPNTPSVFLPYKFLSKGRIVIQKSPRVGPHGNTDLGETHALAYPLEKPTNITVGLRRFRVAK